MPTTTINLAASDGGNGSSDGGKLVKFKSTGALEGRCASTFGVKGTTVSGNGIEGRTETGNGVYALATGSNGIGLTAACSGTDTAILTAPGASAKMLRGVNDGGDSFEIGNDGTLDWSSATAKTGTITNLGLGALSLLNSVDTAEIADNAVTFAKIQDINTSRLLGRTTAGTGSVEEVTVDGGLEFNGSAIRRSALTGDVTASAGSGSTTIASGAVTFDKLAAAAVVTEAEGIASNDNDTTIPTSAAVKAYADSVGGGSGSALTLAVAQASHGLSVGDVVRHNGTGYVTALGTKTNADVVGIVSAVADTGNFTLHMGGVITTLTGLTAGTVYFLSPSAAGEYTATEPTSAGEVTKPLFIAISTTSAIWTNDRGIVIV